MTSLLERWWWWCARTSTWLCIHEIGGKSGEIEPMESRLNPADKFTWPCGVSFSAASVMLAVDKGGLCGLQAWRAVGFSLTVGRSLC